MLPRWEIFLLPCIKEFRGSSSVIFIFASHLIRDQGPGLQSFLKVKDNLI